MSGRSGPCWHGAHCSGTGPDCDLACSACAGTGADDACSACDGSGIAPGQDRRPNLDLDDPLVREMADRHHTPDEQWTGTGLLHGVRCGMCGHAWPCDTRKALRARADTRRSHRLGPG